MSGGSIVPFIDRLEPRMHLSAAVEYRPQKPDGSLDSPVVVTANEAVEDFTPEERSILQQGFTAAEYDVFLKLTNIQGESTDGEHPNEIEILSFSWGEDAAYASEVGGMTPEQSAFQELHVVSRMSKASPKLLQAMTDGTAIADASLSIRTRSERSQSDFLRIGLKNVFVSSYQVRPGGGSDGGLIEEVTLDFAEVLMEYRRQRADRSLDAPV
jgi:type VI secretion system secreted protein Hcp